MVINHIEKLFVTNDAATILRELDIQHPAAKIIIMASQMQEKQVHFYPAVLSIFLRSATIRILLLYWLLLF